jgi:hypothetical protein
MCNFEKGCEVPEIFVDWDHSIIFAEAAKSAPNNPAHNAPTQPADQTFAVFLIHQQDHSCLHSNKDMHDRSQTPCKNYFLLIPSTHVNYLKFPQDRMLECLDISPYWSDFGTCFYPGQLYRCIL